MRDPHALLNLILALHGDVRDEIVAATERQGVERMAAIDRDDEGDTIYASTSSAKRSSHGSPKRWRTSAHS